MHLELLDAAIASPDAPLHLNLFDDVAVLATRESVRTDSLGFTSWTGRIAGAPFSTVTISRRADTVSGHIGFDGRIFVLEPAGAGLYRIAEVDQTRFPPEMPPLPAPGPPARAGAAEERGAAQAEPVIDVLVFYTPAVRARLGDSQLAARIATAMAQLNVALENSQAGGSARIVGTESLALTEDPNIYIDLQRFEASAGVTTRREALGADLVSLIVDDNPAACGVARVGVSTAAIYSVVSEPCIDNYSFAHEIGHNLGAGHAKVDDNGTGGWQPYSFAFKSPNTSPRFRTVMAYDCPTSCERVLQFSSPDIRYENKVAGSATEDNARTVREGLPLVESFRPSKVVTEPPSAPLDARAMVNGYNVTITWRPPATGLVANYRLIAGSSPGGSDLYNASVGLRLSFATPVQPGLYYVRVVAENSLGSSPASDELAIVVGANDFAPGPPRSLVGQAWGNAVRLTWSAPNVGPLPSSYIVEVGSAPGLTDLLTFPMTGPFFEATGVPTGLYYVRVRSRNLGFTSTASNEIALQVGTSGCVAPSAPAGLTFSLSGNFAQLFWAPPVTGTPPFTYIVEAGLSSGAADFFNGNVGPVRTVSASLPPGQYFIRTRATNLCGTSAPSRQVSFLVP